MLRIISRILLFVFLLIISSLIMFIVLKIKIRKKKYKSGEFINVKSAQNLEREKGVEKNTQNIACVILIIILVITLISFLPIENKFIRFNSLEDSMNYSVSDNFLQKNTILNGERCYFILSRRGNNMNFHTISKYGEKVGMVDYKSERKQLGINRDSTGRLIDCYAVYNEKSNQSCYFVIYSIPKGKEKEHSILINEKEMDCIYYVKDGIAVYSLIVEERFKEEVTVTVDGVELPIIPSNEYALNEIFK